MMRSKLTNAQWEWLAKKYIEGRYTTPMLEEFTGLWGHSIQVQIMKRTGGKEEQTKIALEQLEAQRAEFEALANVKDEPYERKSFTQMSTYTREQILWLGQRQAEGYTWPELGAFCYMTPHYLAELYNKLGHRSVHRKYSYQKSLEERGLEPLEPRRAEFMALGKKG